MKLTLQQTKLIGLTKELELKAKEYKMLCNEFENLKKSQTNPNAPEFELLRKKFLLNQQEILNINEQLKALKDN